MKRIKLNYTETTYKKDDNGEILFDEAGNGIIEAKENKEFVLTLDIDENISVKSMNQVNKAFSGMKEGEEINMIFQILEALSIEKENVKLVDKIDMQEFARLSQFVTSAFGEIKQEAEKKILK